MGRNRMETHNSINKWAVTISCFLLMFVCAAPIGVQEFGGKVIITDTSQQFEIEYDGSNQADFTVDSSGNLTTTPSGDMIETPGGDFIAKPTGVARFQPSGDLDDYIEFYTLTGIPIIKVFGGSNLYVESTGSRVRLRLRSGSDFIDMRWQSGDNVGIIASNSDIWLQPSNDIADYFSFTTVAGVPTIGTVGNCDLKITASSGEIDFDNENITTTGNLAADGGTFTSVVTGIFPVTGDHLTTKEYVDLAVGSSFDLFLSDADDAVVAATHVMFSRETGEAQSTETSGTLTSGQDDQLALSWLSETGVPGTLDLRTGVYDAHIHLNKNAGGATTDVYWTLSFVDADGSSNETLVVTSEIESGITTSATSYDIHAVVGAEVITGVTKRLLFKVYGNISAGQNVTITATLEGSTDAHVTFMLPSSVWQNHGDQLDNINSGSTVILSGDTILNGDVHFDGASAGFDGAWTRGSNRFELKDRVEIRFGNDLTSALKFDDTLNSGEFSFTTGSGKVISFSGSGYTRFDHKVAFTQIDGNEYIDSLADGYVDYGATTAHRFNNSLVVDSPTLVVNASGYADKVGIGTASPGEDLEIQSSSPVLRIRDTGATASATAAFIEFGGTDAGVWSRTGYAGDGSSGNTDMYIQAEISDLHLGDSSSNSVLNLQGGNVGIGLTTVDANYKLIIRRAADINLGVGLQSSELAIAAFNDALSANVPLRFYASEFNFVNGNVGIGTTTPAGKLSINGGLHVGGDSNAGDNNLLVDGTTTTANLTATGAITDGTFSVDAGAMTGIASLNGAGTIDLEDNLDGTGFTITAEQLTSTDDITMLGHQMSLGGGATDPYIVFSGTNNANIFADVSATGGKIVVEARRIDVLGDATRANFVMGGGGMTPTDAVTVFRKEGNQDWFELMPGANAVSGFRFYEDSTTGENRPIRIYGYPSGDQKDFGEFKMLAGDAGTETKFEISTDASEGVEMPEIFTTTQTVFFEGVYDDDIGTERPLLIQADGQIGYDSSTSRFKDDIVDFTDYNVLYSLAPKRYTRTKTGKEGVGLIAEDLDALNINDIIPGLVTYDRKTVVTTESGTDFVPSDPCDPNSGDYYVPYEREIVSYTIDPNKPGGINHYQLIVPLLAEVQKLKARIEALERLHN